jgi:hypothetical protein
VSETANGPFLLSVDTDDKPGKAELVFVSFERRVFDMNDPEFVGQQFTLLDPNHPYAKLVKDVLEVET